MQINVRRTVVACDDMPFSPPYAVALISQTITTFIIARVAMIVSLAIAFVFGILAPLPAISQPQQHKECDAEKSRALLGKRYTDALRETAQKLTGAASVIVVRPGSAYSMEYRSDRLNIELDRGGQIKDLRCG
jgi:hypothetical protein